LNEVDRTPLTSKARNSNPGFPCSYGTVNLVLSTAKSWVGPPNTAPDQFALPQIPPCRHAVLPLVLSIRLVLTGEFRDLHNFLYIFYSMVIKNA